MRKISEETIGKIKKLYDRGFSNLKIAKELGIGNQTVSKYLKENFGIEKEKHVKKQIKIFLKNFGKKVNLIKKQQNILK